jgi:hypothetical protein
MPVNLTKVNKPLVYDLFDVSETRSPNVLPHATRELAELNLEAMWQSGLPHTSSIRGCPPADAGRHRLLIGARAYRPVYSE